MTPSEPDLAALRERDAGLEYDQLRRPLDTAPAWERALWQARQDIRTLLRAGNAADTHLYTVDGRVHCRCVISEPDLAALEPDPLGLGRAVADYEATVEGLAEAVRYVATRGVSDPEVSHTPDDTDREYAAALLSAMGRPVLRSAEPCRYCGSVNGETPPSAYSWDPQTGETLRTAIAAACSLTNPRLSEVEWDDVAAILPPLCTHSGDAMTSNDDWIVCTRCNTRWPNSPEPQP